LAAVRLEILVVDESSLESTPNQTAESFLACMHTPEQIFKYFSIGNLQPRLTRLNYGQEDEEIHDDPTADKNIDYRN
jgi:hypothetical protein